MIQDPTVNQHERMIFIIISNQIKSQERKSTRKVQYFWNKQRF